MTILVTGGLGYIGSHTCVELLEKGENLIVLDNLSNSKLDTIEKIEKITNKTFKFYKVDLLNKEEVKRVFDENEIDAVIHFAGLKAVGESVQKPLLYYNNNITGTLNLVEIMQEHQVNKLVFSSSATVYGNPDRVPIKEDMPLSTTNPYGSTKLMLEQVLQDICLANSQFKVVILRYFNPIGAHKSGIIGENPNGIPNNLMPYICKVASGKLNFLNIYGNDYETEDGTGVRDYIHVVDLAKGHLSALERMEKNDSGAFIYNLGTGKGYSVMDIVKTFENENNIKINYKMVERRPGDIAKSFADPSKALMELNWKAEKTLKDMVRDAWKYEINNS
ncbi:MAG: UDP-glucose 4-epimerase GalE [Clostridia bacterium]|nr:UDP-glucose 4-epimerase GalE [Clostridia bacterium]